MDELGLQAVAARVVAWHNRHPLARRITAAQVHSIGYVALPYSTGAPETAAPAAEGGSLRERALARAKLGDAAPPAPPPPATADPATLSACFSEDFIAPLKPRQVARWARRRGRQLVQAPTDGPLREVIANPAPAGQRPVTLYVLTAAIEAGAVRSRVLLGAGNGLDLLGRRLISAPRAAAPLVAALGLGVALNLALRSKDVPLPAAATHAAALPASAAASAPPPLQAAPTLQLAQAQAHDTPPAEPDAAAPALQVPPVDVEPRLGRVQLPPLDLPLKDEARAAARQARLANEAASAPVAQAQAETPVAPVPAPAAAPGETLPPVVVTSLPPPRLPPAAASPATASTASTAVTAAQPRAPRSGPAIFAVSTRVLRTRAEAEQIAIAMDALLQSVSPGDLRVEVLPQGDDWRVVGWPFPAAAQADKARALLAARGMRVAVVDF